MKRLFAIGLMLFLIVGFSTDADAGKRSRRTDQRPDVFTATPPPVPTFSVSPPDTYAIDMVSMLSTPWRVVDFQNDGGGPVSFLGVEPFTYEVCVNCTNAQALDVTTPVFSQQWGWGWKRVTPDQPHTVPDYLRAFIRLGCRDGNDFDFKVSYVKPGGKTVAKRIDVPVLCGARVEQWHGSVFTTAHHHFGFCEHVEVNRLRERRSHRRW